MLDDSITGIDDLQEKIKENVQWGVFRVNEEGEPIGRLGGLHEDMADLAPPQPKAPAPKKARPKNTKK